LQKSEGLKTRLKHLFGDTVCNVSLTKSRVAFNGDLAFLIGGKGGTKNEKTETINFSVGHDFIYDTVFLECERFGW
jgi:hypothetical protein